MHHSTFAFTVFILIFVIIFVSLHAYIYYRTRTALELGKISSVIIGIFFSAMIFSPFIIRIAEKNNLNIISTFFAYTGYTWMGILSTLVLSLLFFDIIHLILNFLSKYIILNKSLLLHFNKYTFLLSTFITFLFTIIGIFEAQGIKVNKISIESPHLKKELSPLKVAQISDVHISQTLGFKYFSEITQKINELKPDILVITGDLADVDIRKNHRIINLLKNINTKYGKYAITGNHEFYTGVEIATEFYKNTDVKFLRGEFFKPVDGLILIGVDDDNGKNFDDYVATSEDKIMEGLNENTYIILLKHKPYVDENIIQKIDLQLSGHVHGGQIFPFSLIVKSIYRYFAGLYKISDRMYLYVSRGTGYWGPPIRFLSSPEITLIEIKNSDKK